MSRTIPRLEASDFPTPTLHPWCVVAELHVNGSVAFRVPFASLPFRLREPVIVPEGASVEYKIREYGEEVENEGVDD